MKLIRPLQLADMEVAREIHRRYWKEEFEFPDFGKFNSAYTTVDSNGDIVAVGGVRPIYECVVITDLEQSIFSRRSSYFQILNLCSESVRLLGANEIHAFVQGDKWTDTLRKAGFRDTVGKALVREA